MQYVHLDCTAPACGWETRLELKARFCLGHFKLSWDGWQLVSYTPPLSFKKRSFAGNHILHLFWYCRQLFVVIAYIEIAAAVVFGWPQTNPKRRNWKAEKWIFGYSSEEGIQIYSTYCCIVFCNLWQLSSTWVNPCWRKLPQIGKVTQFNKQDFFANSSAATYIVWIPPEVNFSKPSPLFI